MRLDIFDCDVDLPTIEDIIGPDAEVLSPEMLAYLPTDRQTLAELWLNLIDLSLLLEKILKIYYRPRSTPPSPSQLQQDETDILHSRDRIPHLRPSVSHHVSIYALHLKTYYE